MPKHVGEARGSLATSPPKHHAKAPTKAKRDRSRKIKRNRIAQATDLHMPVEGLALPFGAARRANATSTTISRPAADVGEPASIMPSRIEPRESAPEPVAPPSGPVGPGADEG